MIWGINRRNVELIFVHNPRRDWPWADDKLTCKAALQAAGVPVPPTLLAVRALGEIEDALRALSGRGDFVVKPARGSRGRGVLVVRERVGPGLWRRAGGGTLDAERLGLHLARAVLGDDSGREQDAALVEERVETHPALCFAEGLVDVRVLTLRGEPILAMLRVPTARSQGKANLHQGGVGVALGLHDGRALRALWRGRPVEAHPDSGRPFAGLSVPDWPQVLEVAVRAARASPLGYLGVDVALDAARGPLVLEVNARPGLEIQNVHGRGLPAKP